MPKKKQRSVTLKKKLLILSIFLGCLTLFCTLLFTRRGDVLSLTIDCTTGAICPSPTPSPTPTAFCLIQPACPAITPPATCSFSIKNCQCVYSCTTFVTPTPTVFLSGCQKPTCAAPPSCVYKPNGNSCSCGDLYCIVGPKRTPTPTHPFTPPQTPTSVQNFYNKVEPTVSSKKPTPDEFEPSITIVPMQPETTTHQSSDSFITKLFTPVQNFFAGLRKNYFSFFNVLR